MIKKFRSSLKDFHKLHLRGNRYLVLLMDSLAIITNRLFRDKTLDLSREVILLYNSDILVMPQTQRNSPRHNHIEVKTTTDSEGNPRMANTFST